MTEIHTKEAKFTEKRHGMNGRASDSLEYPNKFQLVITIHGTIAQSKNSKYEKSW